LERAEKASKNQIKKELLPFLFNQEELKFLDYFPELVEKMKLFCSTDN